MNRRQLQPFSCELLRDDSQDSHDEDPKGRVGEGGAEAVRGARCTCEEKGSSLEHCRRRCSCTSDPEVLRVQPPRGSGNKGADGRPGLVVRALPPGRQP